MKLSNNNNSVVGNKIKIKCDLLCVAGGYTPTVHLFTQSGGKLSFDEKKFYFYPDKTTLDQISVGACSGIFDLKKIIRDTNLKVNDFLGTNIKKPTLNEIKSQHITSFRRGVYLNKDFKKGKKIKESDLVCLRPNLGVDARNYKSLIGKKTKKNIRKLEKLVIKKNV